MSVYDLFEEFWKNYPKRDGFRDRHGARMLFEKIVQNGVDARRIIEGARSYRLNLGNTDPRFVVMPVNWLHRRGWEDYEDSIMDEAKLMQLYLKYNEKERMKW